jgi:predicted ATPase
VYAVEEDGGRAFLAMEYVTGSDLRTRLHSSETDLKRVFDVTTQIASGLASAHEAGVIHRDIKPENIHLGDDGRVRIMDFGLARIQMNMTGSKTGPLRGTAPYMSPEQIQNQPVDHRSDIFSLGVLLYELVTGQRPFTGDYEPAVLYSIIFADPADPQELNPQCPPALADLINRCLAKDPAARVASCNELVEGLERSAEQWTSAQRSIAEGAGPVAPKRSPDATLVGRDRELGMITVHLDRAVRGQGYTVILSGEAGIGKSRLALEATEEARRSGLSVFSGRCLAQGGGLPYHAMSTAIKKNFNRLDSRVLDGLAEKARDQGHDLISRLPALRNFLQLEGAGPELINKEQLWDAVLHLIHTMAKEKPLLFIIDDLQWADPATLDLVTFLARNVADLPVLLLCAWREGDPTGSDTATAPLDTVMRQLRLEKVAESISLKRLNTDQSEDAARTLLKSGRIEKSLLGWLVESADGNPLFLAELVAWVQSSGIAVQEDGTWKRVDASARSVVPVEDSDRELLALAACEPDEFRSEGLAECLNRSRIDILHRLQDLEARHRVIRHDGTLYRFDHPLIKQVLYDSQLPELRQEYHRMLADRLVQREGDVSAQAGRIAHHLLAAEAPGQAFPYLIEAGHRALDLFATDEAQSFFQQATKVRLGMADVDASLTCRLARGMGDCLSVAGEPEAALEHYRTLMRLAEALSDDNLLLEARRKAAEQLRIRGELDEAMNLASLAVETAVPNSVDHVLGLNTLAFIHAARSEYDKTIALSGQAVDIARGLGDIRNQSVGQSQMGHAYWHMGDYVSAAEYLQKAIDLQRDLGDRRGLANSLNFASLAYWRTAELERGLNLMFESLAVPGSLNGIGDIYREIGDLKQAEQYHLKSLALAREYGNRGSECDSLRDLGVDYMLQGKLDKAEPYLTEVLQLARERGFQWYETRALIGLAELHLSREDVDQARPLSDEAGALAENLQTQELIIDALRLQARVNLAAAKPELAGAELTRALEVARRTGNRMVMWQLLGDLSEVLAQQGDSDAALPLREEARALLNTITESFGDRQLRETFQNSPPVKHFLNAE